MNKENESSEKDVKEVSEKEKNKTVVMFILSVLGSLYIAATIVGIIDNPLDMLYMLFVLLISGGYLVGRKCSALPYSIISLILFLFAIMFFKMTDINLGLTFITGGLALQVVNQIIKKIEEL